MRASSITIRSASGHWRRATSERLQSGNGTSRVVSPMVDHQDRVRRQPVAVGDGFVCSINVRRSQSENGPRLLQRFVNAIAPVTGPVAAVSASGSVAIHLALAAAPRAPILKWPGRPGMRSSYCGAHRGKGLYVVTQPPFRALPVILR